MDRTSRFFLLATVLLFTSTASFPAFAESSSPVPSLRPESNETIGLLYPEPASVLDIYRAIGKAFRLHVVFDQEIHDTKFAIQLDDVTALEALHIISKTAGHFFTALDAKTVLIADDTPQNRRIYEQQVIRTFHLENIALKDAMTMLRSLLGLKSIAANEQLNGIVVRDTAAKVAVAGRLLETVDKHRGEVGIDVEVLYLTGKALARRAETHHADASEFESLRRSARRLTRHEISVQENQRGLWAVKDVLGPGVEVGFELAVVPRLHPASDELTLELGLQFADKTHGADKTRGADQSAIATHKIESGARVRSGETFLMTGLTVGPFERGEGSWLASRFDLPAQPGEVVLALTPRIVREPGFDESDLAGICIGTETAIGLCSGKPALRTAAHP